MIKETQRTMRIIGGCKGLNLRTALDQPVLSLNSNLKGLVYTAKMS